MREPVVNVVVPDAGPVLQRDVVEHQIHVGVLLIPRLARRKPGLAQIQPIHLIQHCNEILVLTVVGLAKVRLAAIGPFVALLRRVATVRLERNERAVPVRTLVAVVALRFEQMTDRERRLGGTVVVEVGEPVLEIGRAHV